MQQKQIKTTPVFAANKQAFESGQYRVIANQGSTRSSKTFSIVQLLIIVAMKQMVQITVCSPSLPHLKRGARKDFLDILKDWGVYSDKNFNKTDNIYKFPNTGSQIEFFGADEVDKLRGPGRDILYINESNLISRASYTQLALRTKKTIFIDFNPADEYSWVYDVADTPGNKLIHSTYKNNLANISKPQIQEIEALKDADENLWRVFGLGLRGTSSETIYTHWKEIENFPACDDVCYGLDFGYNHPTALIKVGFVDGKIYCEEMLYESKLTNNDLAYVLKTMGLGKTTDIYCDTARPETIEEIKRCGLNVKPALKAVWDGIQMVKSRPLFITKGSTNLIKELKSYKFKVDKDGKVLDEPIKFMDDAVDAMRYGIYSRIFKPKKTYQDANY